MTQAYIEAMAKHLPPSAAQLRLLDVGGHAGATLAALRGDLEIIALASESALGDLAANSADAITAYNPTMDESLLRAALNVLRPGGRLIMVDAESEPSPVFVELLDAMGFVRILIENALSDEQPGVLARGEKPHTTADTLERIQQVAEQDSALTDFDQYSGRYVHLLIQQRPNKPVWALRPDEPITWEAVGVQTDAGVVLLAFSSLPRAVGFMQPAVMQGRIKDVNKVGKFRREVAQGWAHKALLNPSLDDLAGLAVILVPVDHAMAEAPGE